jgi:outer membrane immunogenic protein
VKKLSSLAALALFLSVGSAMAADLPSRKGPAPAFVPPPPMWTGFYVGLNAGGTWGESGAVDSWSYNFQATPNLLFGPAAAALATTSLPVSGNVGFIGGGQVGYNWQFGSSFMAGIEADIQGVAGSGSSSTAVGRVVVANGDRWSIGQVATASQSLDYLGTVRGRLGWLFSPTLMVYGTGGLAYGGVTANAGVTQLVFEQPPAYSTNGSFSDTRVGWTAGGGLEWMFAPNWSAKVEYLYYDLGSVTFNHAPLVNPGTIPGVIWYSNSVTSNARFNGHIVRAGVNYHFNFGSASTVAGY